MIEIWKDIKGFENYQISSIGRVKSKLRNLILCQERTKKGYLRVQLYADGKSYNIKVHRIVAMEFVNNPSPLIYKQINHKDGNKENNEYTNLEWCNTKMNVRHAVEHGLHKSTKGKNGN